MLITLTAMAQQTLGQYEITLELADMLLGLCLRRPADRILDPGCGAGIFLQRAGEWLDWLAAAPSDLADEAVWGIELDGQAARMAHDKLSNARIINQNFFAQEPGSLPKFDVIAGNPPYAPTQYIGSFENNRARQLPMFPEDGDSLPASEKRHLVSRKLTESLSGRSGLHAYYFLHSEQFLNESGRLGLVVPNGWLDIAYGVELKQFLLDHFRILAIVESSVERWFPEASVNTCLVILEKCGVWHRRTNNLVRLIRLRAPLEKLFFAEPTDPQRFVSVENFLAQLMSSHAYEGKEYGVHIMPQGALRAEGKWGKALRAPAVYRRHRDHLDLHTLKRWATVQRGYTTGANEFFYLDPDKVADWSIESAYRRPLLKSLRGVDQLQLQAADCNQELLLIGPNSNVRHTAVDAYIKWGEERGYHLRQTCMARQTWYVLPEQQAASLILPKGIWQRHLALHLEDEIAIDQQLYRILPAEHVSIVTAAALLNSAWFALQIELHGRVNLGKGLLWLAAYELSEVRLPDPRRLRSNQVDRLESSFLKLASNPWVDGQYDLSLPARMELDEAVFDILGFTPKERTAVLDSLNERVSSRKQLASYVREK